MSPRLSATDVRIFHRTTYIPSMRYGLAAVATDEEALGTVQSRVIQAILKKTEYVFYVLLLYTWEQFTQPARYPTASEGTAGHRVLRGLKFSTYFIIQAGFDPTPSPQRWTTISH